MAEDYAAQKLEAARLPRDKFGRFLKSQKTTIPGAISKLLTKNISITKGTETTSTANKETFVDIHINNPLTKIVELLKDIKNQKAFSFTLKGSVGIMGVAVVLVGGGILGGNRIMCSKGTQARIGEVRVLAYSQPAVSDQPIRNKIRAFFGKVPTLTPPEYKWVILVDSNGTAVRLLNKTQSYLESFAGHTVTAVGDLNGCNQELTVATNGIEEYSSQ